MCFKARKKLKSLNGDIHLLELLSITLVESKSDSQFFTNMTAPRHCVYELCYMYKIALHKNFVTNISEATIHTASCQPAEVNVVILDLFTLNQQKKLKEKNLSSQITCQTK